MLTKLSQRGFSQPVLGGCCLSWRLKPGVCAQKLHSRWCWGVCFPPLRHIPGREVVPGCFFFLPGEFLAALGSSRTGPAHVPLQTSLFLARRCRLDAASSVPRASARSPVDAPWFPSGLPKNARQDLDRRHLGGLTATKQRAGRSIVI